MSLNGLDDATVKEAHSNALAEAGGWFLLQYSSRDAIKLYEQGVGGVGELRTTLTNYADKSPLFGFLLYRRRKVLIKFVPSGTSRLLQARVTVHFESVADKFSPHDATISATTVEEVNENALSSACSLHTANATASSASSIHSYQRSNLDGITEDAEEDPALPTSSGKSTKSKSPTSELPTNQDVAESVYKTDTALIQDAVTPTVNGDDPSTTPRPSTPVSQIRRSNSIASSNVPDAASIRSNYAASEVSIKRYENAQQAHNGDSAAERRLSSQTLRAPETEKFDFSQFNIKPKVKLGPRLFNAADGRRPPSTVSAKSISTLPAGVKMALRKSEKQAAPTPSESTSTPTSAPAPISAQNPTLLPPPTKPKSQHDKLAVPRVAVSYLSAAGNTNSTSHPSQPLVPPTPPDTPEAMIPQAATSPARSTFSTRSNMSHASSPARGGTGVSREKQKLRKALELRRKQFQAAASAGSAGNGENVDKGDGPVKVAETKVENEDGSTVASTVPVIAPEVISDTKSVVNEHVSNHTAAGTVDEKSDAIIPAHNVAAAEPTILNSVESNEKVIIDNADSIPILPRSVNHRNTDEISTEEQKLSDPAKRESQRHSVANVPATINGHICRNEAQVNYKDGKKLVSDIEPDSLNYKTQAHERGSAQLLEELESTNAHEADVPSGDSDMLHEELKADSGVGLSSALQDSREAERSNREPSHTAKNVMEAVKHHAVTSKTDNDRNIITEEADNQNKTPSSSFLHSRDNSNSNYQDVTSDTGIHEGHRSNASFDLPLQGTRESLERGRIDGAGNKSSAPASTPEGPVAMKRAESPQHRMQPIAEGSSPAKSERRKSRRSDEVSNLQRSESQLRERRRGQLEPMQIDLSAPSSDAGSSDDSLMAELQSAKVEEAKPVSVSKSPVNPFFSRHPSATSVQSAGKRSMSLAEANGWHKASNGNSPASSKVSTNIYSFTNSPKMMRGEQTAVAKKVNVSSGISQRIKALAQLTGRTSPPPPVPTISKSSKAESPFISERMNSFRSNASQPSQPHPSTFPNVTSTPKEIKRSSKISFASRPTSPPQTAPASTTPAKKSLFSRDNASRIFSREANASKIFSREANASKIFSREANSSKISVSGLSIGKSKSDNLSVTARIVRDSRSSTQDMPPPPPPSITSRHNSSQYELQHSHLTIQRHSSQDDSHHPPAVPAVPAVPASLPSLPSSPTKSFSRSRSFQGALPRSSSESSWRQFRRRQSDAKSTPPPSSSKSVSNSSFDEEENRHEDSKRSSRTSRLFKRMSSSIGGSSRKGTMTILSPVVREEEQELVEAASRRGCAQVGDLNVQFPDTLLWKRRWVEVDVHGNLILGVSKASQNAKVANRRYHLSEFQRPFAPDQDQQELPNSVVLDFLDGSTLQCACEDSASQAMVLKILQEQHHAWTS